jgi:hypothetical protein
MVIGIESELIELKVFENQNIKKEFFISIESRDYED